MNLVIHHIFRVISKICNKISRDLNKFVQNIWAREKLLIDDISIVFLNFFSNRNNAALSNSNIVTFSIVIPTYNESENILRLISEIEKNLPTSAFTEIIVVDDNSPDGTGKLVEDCITKKGIKAKEKNSSHTKNHILKVV